MTYTKSHTPRATPSHGTSLVIAQDVLGFPSLRSFFIRPNDHADPILVMFINFTARGKVFGTEWEKNVDVYELCKKRVLFCISCGRTYSGENTKIHRFVPRSWSYASSSHLAALSIFALLYLITVLFLLPFLICFQDFTSFYFSLF